MLIKMNNSWTEIIKDINVTTWIFIREYLRQLNQIPECDRTSEQKLIYRQYDKYDDIIINLSDDDIQKLSFSSACSFEITENSCNECLKYLNDNIDKKYFLNPENFKRKPSNAHDEMLKGFTQYYLNNIAEISRKISNFFQNKKVLTSQNSEIQDRLSSQILGNQGKKLAEAVVNNSDVNFNFIMDRIEIKILPRFNLKNLKNWQADSKKNNNILTTLAIDLFSI